MDSVTVGQVSLPVRRFPSVSIIPPMPYIHSPSTLLVPEDQKVETSKICALSESLHHWMQRFFSLSFFEGLNRVLKFWIRRFWNDFWNVMVNFKVPSKTLILLADCMGDSFLRKAFLLLLLLLLLLQSALQPLWVLACSTIVEYSQQEGFYRVPLPAARQTPNLEDQ